MKGFKERGRDRYVTDDEFEKVKAHAHFTVADAMDLALLTGQRPADVLKIRRSDIRDGALWIVQNKTGARLGIEITGELAVVIDRINARPRQSISAHLIQDETGQPLSMFALRSRFDKAREAARVSFQFRDNRTPSCIRVWRLLLRRCSAGHSLAQRSGPAPLPAETCLSAPKRRRHTRARDTAQQRATCQREAGHGHQLRARNQATLHASSSQYPS